MSLETITQSSNIDTLRGGSVYLSSQAFNQVTHNAIHNQPIVQPTYAMPVNDKPLIGYEPKPLIEDKTWKNPIRDMIPDNYVGSQGESMGVGNNYLKTFNNDQDKLNVHAPNGVITGAKFNDNPINNYDASMFDLLGTQKKNTGGNW